MCVLRIITTVLLSIPLIHSNVSPSLIDISCSHLPTMAEHGQRVIMSCCPTHTTSWFSIKWYKEAPDWQLTQQDRTGKGVLVYNKEDSDVVVDSVLTTLGRLVLLNVTESGQGWYKCEVTGPAPVYHTATIRTFLTVVKLPYSLPMVKVVEDSDKLVAISCTVPVPASTPVEML